MTSLNITVLPGDGIGPEVVEQGIKVLKAIEQRFNIKFDLTYGLIGGAAIDKTGVPLPEETLRQAQASRAVLMGSVGGPAYDALPPAVRPEQGLLQIRKKLNLYANLRPVKVYSALIHASTLKPDVLEGVDLMVIRELTGGLYFGEPKSRTSHEAVDTMRYTRQEIERIAEIAFQAAMKRSKRLCSVDKANVLATSQLWREIVTETSSRYPEVALTHLYVDNAAMQLIRNPRQFDVILTENTFGDILSDEAAMLTSSLGMLPSASLGESHALYEPSHGSAPDIAGQNRANPIATILSVSMMLSYSFGLSKEAALLDRAVETVLKAGYRTPDIADAGAAVIGTSEMGDRIAETLRTIP